MSVIDLTSIFVLVGLMVVRFAVPVFGIWLLGQGLKRLAPLMP